MGDDVAHQCVGQCVNQTCCSQHGMMTDQQTYFTMSYDTTCNESMCKQLADSHMIAHDDQLVNRCSL